MDKDLPSFMFPGITTAVNLAHAPAGACFNSMCTNPNTSQELTPAYVWLGSGVSEDGVEPVGCRHAGRGQVLHPASRLGCHGFAYMFVLPRPRRRAASRRRNRSNLADMGWERCALVPHYGRGTPWLLTFGGREATVKCCGVAVAMPRGYSRVPPSSSDQSVNTGTFPALPGAVSSRGETSGWVHRRPIGSGEGGAAVVLRGRESRPHGEGRQRDRMGGAAMPEDTVVDTAVTWPSPQEAGLRVREMQTKLHRWAAADHGRRFDDVYNFVSDPATLVVALQWVAGNAGARTAGVDGVTAVHVSLAGPEVFLDHVRSLLKTGTFRPLPVREKMIPKTGGKLRRLGIPTITDRVV